MRSSAREAEGWMGPRVPRELGMAELILVSALLHAEVKGLGRLTGRPAFC